MKKALTALSTSAGALLLSAQYAFAQSTDVLPSSGDIKAGGNLTVAKLVADLINGAILVGALAVLLYLILGGFQWLTSGGDKGKTEKARGQITSALIGLLIIVASWAIFQLVLKFFGIGNLNDLSNSIINNP